MKKTLLIILAFLLLIGFIGDIAIAQQNIYIEPGKGVGKVKLDMTAKEIIQMLGKPHKIMDSPNFKEIQYYIYYGRYKMNVTILRSTQRVVEIAVYAPHYRTLSGLRVGSKRILVESEYGKKPQVVAHGDRISLFYPSAGINFGLKKDVVKVITVRGNNYSSSEVLYMGR